MNGPLEQRRYLGLAVLVGLVLYCLAMGVSAALYPGGTWFDSQAVGHRFWENFWCDLLRERGHNGEPNIAGSRIALGGWLALSAAMVPFWSIVPAAMPGSPRLGAWVRGLGIFSAIAMVAIFLTPSDRFPRLHGITITAAAGPGLVALASSVWALGRREQPLELRASGWALASFATANFLIYSREYWLGLPGSPILPPVQKAATICAVVWMVCVVRHVVRRAPPPAAGRGRAG
jgi:hypothetical protein